MNKQKKLKLCLKIQDGKIDNSEYYLSESHINVNNDKSYKDVIFEQIKKHLGNENIRNIGECWQLLKNYIDENNFKHFKTLALKKGTKKFENLLKNLQENASKDVDNVAIILYANELQINNVICFFVKLKIDNNKTSLDPFIASLTRIEFFDWNLKTISKSHSVELCSFNEKYEHNNIELENLFKYELIFEDEDYDYKKDPIKFQGWLKFIKFLRKKFNVKRENVDNVDNYIFKNNNDYILIAKNSIDFSQSKYNLFDNKSGQNLFDNDEVKNDFGWKQNDYDILNEFNIEIKKSDELIKNNNELIRSNNELISNNNRKINELENSLKQLSNSKKEYQQKINEIDKSKNKSLLTSKSNLQKKMFDSKIIDINNKVNQIKLSISNLMNDTKISEKENKEKIQQNQIQENKIQNFQEIIKWMNKTNFNICKMIIPTNNIEKLKQKKIISIQELMNNNVKYDVLINYMESYSFIDNNAGTRAIINRFFYALKNIEDGYYKNPLFFLGIRKPNKILEIYEKNKLDIEIKEKYMLNEKQHSVVQKAINTNCVFYLQGPPGTGKTQTISAITEHVINNKMNVVMTSSTHEAINNFFDRISEKNFNNPNIVLLKYRAFGDNNNNYSQETLFRNFKNRMMANITKKDNVKKDLINYLNNFDDQIPEKYSNILPRPIVEYIFNDFDNLKFYFYKNENNDELLRPIGYEESMTSGIEKKLKSLENDHTKKEKEFCKIIKKIFDNISILNIDLNQINFKNNYLKQLIGLINLENNNQNLYDFISAIETKYASNKIDNEEEAFLDYIVNNKLINVIGLTTTAKNEITIKNNNISLYSEYPIDYIIIDEISKCSMPEILSKSILSKKVVFAGDYLQLPPQSNLNNDNILNYLIENDFKFNEDENNHNDVINKDKNAYKKEIDLLFKKSFFVELIKMIKKSDSLSNMPYEFLNESHRFGKEILDIVNVIYKEQDNGEEQLRMPNKSTYKFDLINYDLKIDGNNLSNPVCLINLVKPLDEFKKAHNFNLDIEYSLGFDQVGKKTFAYNGNEVNVTVESSYNQWSAFFVVEILKKIIEQNWQKIANTKKKIGIITLTIAQKQIILEYIKFSSELKKYKQHIKVDTIDNFQGREEEIIIVDFIRGNYKINNKHVEKTSKRNITFLSEKERINVALSRAKQKLIMVGQFNYLVNLKISLFKKYFNMLKDSMDSYIEIGDKNG